jgi:hypothetical protein
MVGSKLSKCPTEFDRRIRRAYQWHSGGDDDDCETNCFYKKIVPRFVLKILAADIPKTRHPGSGASSPVTIKRRRAIIAVNKREPVALASHYRDRLHTSFRFILAAVTAMSVPTGQRMSQCVLDEELSLYRANRSGA